MGIMHMLGLLVCSTTFNCCALLRLRCLPQLLSSASSWANVLANTRRIYGCTVFLAVCIGILLSMHLRLRYPVDCFVYA